MFALLSVQKCLLGPQICQGCMWEQSPATYTLHGHTELTSMPRHICLYSCAYEHSCVFACTHGCTCACTPVYIHSHSHVYLHLHRYIAQHTCSHMYTLTHIDSHVIAQSKTQGAAVFGDSRADLRARCVAPTLLQCSCCQTRGQPEHKCKCLEVGRREKP